MGGVLSHILPVASDAPVRGTGFTSGRSSPGADAVLLSAPDAPTRGAFFFFFVFSQLPRTLQSLAPGLPPDDPVRGLAPCFIPPRMLQSGVSFCRTLSAAVCTVAVLVPASLSPLLVPPYDSACPVPDAPVHATGASAVPFPPVPFLTSPSAAKPYTRPTFISAGFSFVCVPSGVPSDRLPLCPQFLSLPLTALVANLAASVLPSP